MRNTTLQPSGLILRDWRTFCTNKQTDPDNSNPSINEGERSFIALRRLYSWMRTSMTENRLTDLARMHIYPYRLSNVSDIRVIHIFSLNQPRRLETKRLHDFGRKYNFFFLSYQRIFFNFFLKQDSLKFILYMLRTPSLT